MQRYASWAMCVPSLNQVDWLPVPVYPKVLRLVSRLNGKIFVGTGLHQNEEWIDISCNVSTMKQTSTLPFGHSSAAVHKKHLSLLRKVEVLPSLASSHRTILHPRTSNRLEMQRQSARSPRTNHPAKGSARKRRRLQKAK